MSDKTKTAEIYRSKGLVKLTAENLRITSPVDVGYNCIAWAASENIRWWWPDKMEQAYWPPGIERATKIETFIAAYATLGYEVCGDGNHERGFEKIVIYCKDGVPTHAARLISGDEWTSKLGQGHDVSHAIDLLDGPLYGAPHTFMRRYRNPSVS
jgi:hypothetical protein